MKKFSRLVAAFCILLAPAAFADTSAPAPDATPANRVELKKAADSFDYDSAGVLGIVEGLTEYLPVSSTGHLIIANELLGLEEDVAVLDKTGEQIWVLEKEPLPVRVWKKLAGEKKAEPLEVPFTLKNAADAYIIVIQFGAILAVLFAYWQRVAGLIVGTLQRRRESLLLARNLVVAFLPAAVIGLIFNKIIEDCLFGIGPVIAALFVGAVMMLWIQARYRRLLKAGAFGAGETDLHELGIGKSLGIGFMQCLAMWPGTSRSMATICGGYLVGLSPVRATEFSFLLGLLTLSAASFYKVYSTGALLLKTFEIGPLAFGMVFATITAFFSVKWMVGWISRHGLALFAWYRIALAIVLAIWFGAA